jgi:hypothetical protein
VGNAVRSRRRHAGQLPRSRGQKQRRVIADAAAVTVKEIEDKAAWLSWPSSTALWVA